jgi:hypothetical protein
MSDHANPYLPGQPVENPNLFFGRREVLTSIREHLLKGRRVFVVAGDQRMGKTSLLWQLSAHLPPEFITVRVELLEERTERFDWLLWRLADAVDQQVSNRMGVERLGVDWADFDGQPGHLLEQFWPRMRATLGDSCLVLLLDDVDSLHHDGTDLLAPLVEYLAAWRDQDEGLATVLATTEAWAESLVREHPRLFGGAFAYTLGPLSSEEATRLITWPVDGVLTYDFGVARRLIEITSGHPYFLQLLCFEVFNRCALAGWVIQRDVELVLEDLVAREIPDFRQIWDRSSPREQATLAALVSLRGARGVATALEVRTVLVKAGARVERGQVTRALESLVARGILERLGALSYRFRVALLRDWLGERVDLEEIVRQARWGSAERETAASQRRVPKLRIGQESRARREPATGAAAAAARPAGEQAESDAARPRPTFWIAAVVVLGLALTLSAGAWLLGPLSPDPTPTSSPSPSAVALLSTATRTPALAATTTVLVVAEPTDALPPTETPTPSPTPPLVIARPVPAIAYQSRAEGEKRWSIYVMSSDGGDRHRLAESQSGFLSPPSWSPDGSQIAFVSDRDGSQDIWVMDSDGSNPVNLTHEPAKDYSPAWSPDGDWIAFASVRDAPYWEIYAMRPDGSDVQRLTWWEDASDWSPAWSPDGTRLAFASKRDGNWEIYTMDRNGSNLVRLTDDPADDTNPAWSPDGSRIAFESTRAGYTDVFVLPAAGGSAQNLSNLAWATDLGPTWSPDGGRIAFYSDRDGDWDVYVMASDGSGVAKLTGDTTNDQLPAWRP